MTQHTTDSNQDRMTLQDYVDLLASCETADDVAELCRMHGVRGKCATSWACPLAVLGAALTGQEVRVGAAICGDGQYFRKPDAAYHFVCNFDLRGAYPDLEAA